MKLVLISGFPLFPVNQGNRSRILALVRAIRELGGELTFVLVPRGVPDLYDRDAHVAEFAPGQFIEFPPESRRARILRMLRWFPFRMRRKICRKLNLRTGFYAGLDETWRPGWTAQLAALHAERGFDAAIVEYVFHSAALTAFPASVRKLIDTHDAFADRHISYVAQGIPHDYFISLRPEEEDRGFRRADAILAIQAEEAQNFCKRLGTDPRNPEVHVVNHFLDLADAPVADHAKCSGVFLASRNSANTLSARNFVEQTLPLILARLPQFRFMLAGSICEVVDDHPAIVKLGFVDRMIDAFTQAPLLINPMRVGTGIAIKMLDAMAAGVPAVSTDVGARGLPQQFAESVLIVPEQDHQAFADRVVTLIQDEPLRRELGHKARRAAEQWNMLQRATLRDALRINFSAGEAG